MPSSRGARSGTPIRRGRRPVADHRRPQPHALLLGSSSASELAVLERNPNYHGSRPAPPAARSPDDITTTPSEHVARKIDGGKADLRPRTMDPRGRRLPQAEDAPRGACARRGRAGSAPRCWSARPPTAGHHLSYSSTRPAGRSPTRGCAAPSTTPSTAARWPPSTGTCPPPPTCHQACAVHGTSVYSLAPDLARARALTRAAGR